MEKTNVSSPLATGGAGTTFEQHVGAMFLVHLLIRGIPAVFKNCQVEEVSFQTRHLGWETDDLLVTCSTDTDGRRQLAIQAKRRFNVGISYPDCVQTFQGFWKDFKVAERFDTNKDALVLATLHSSNALDGLCSLLECARSSSNAEDFTHRLATPGFVSRKTKNCQHVIRSIVRTLDSSDIDEAEFWCFLKAIHILFLDFTSSTAQQEAGYKQFLALSADNSDAVSDAEATWNNLLGIAATSASRARTLSRSDLPDTMCALHNTIPAPRTALQSLTEHSGITLDAISSTIAEKVTLPRREITTKAVEALAESQVVVLTGPPGCGKSALAKMVVQQQANDHMCLSFRAEEFAESHIDRVLQGSITGQQFATLMCAQERVLVHVESLERLLEHSTRDAFTDFVEITKRCPNVRLLLTCRDYSITTALAAFFERSQLAHDVIEVPLLHEEEMEEVTNEFPELAIPMSSPRLRQLLRAPYLLDMAAKMDWSDQRDMPLDIRAFREKCWCAVIRKDPLTADGLPDRRGQALVDLAVRRARKLRPFVPIDGIDIKALDSLHKDGIVFKNKMGLAAPAHDVIEDWAITCWIELLTAKHEWLPHPIAEAVDQYPAIRRGFREWLKEELDRDADKASRFVLSISEDDSLPTHFRNDVLVSVLLSHSARDFILRQKNQLLADDARLLIRLIHLARVACRKAPKRVDGQIMPLSVLLEPEGEAWPTLLETVADEFDRLLPTHTEPILGLLEDWSHGAVMNSQMPDGAIPVGQIAYPLLKQLGGYHNDGFRKRVLKIIARAPRSSEESFIDLLERASSRSEWRDGTLREFTELIIYETDGIQACRDFPERMTQITLSWCCLQEQDREHASRFDISMGTELDFGLRASLNSGFLPRSAIRGPFLPLLIDHPDIGIRLVLDFVNHAGDWYCNRKWPTIRLEPAHPITISILGGDVKQWANERLWNAYRGTSVTPYIIQCALMALESWLLKMCEDSISVEPWLLKILQESKNVMTTAVVASVCNAYPGLCGTAALALLKSRKCIELDRRRMAKEHESAWVALPGPRPMDGLYNSERRRSNALTHRRHDLEALSLKLQSKGKAEQIQEIIDGHLAKMPHEAQRTDEDRIWLLALHRMDFRCLKAGNATPLSNSSGSENEAGENMVVPLVIGKMDADLQNFANAGAEENRQSVAVSSLLNWGLRQWKQKSKSEDADSWRAFLASARGACREKVTLGGGLLEMGQGIVAAVCVRDHLEDIAGDDRQWCIATLIAGVELDSDSENFTVHMSVNPMSPDRHAAYVLPKVLACDPGSTEILEAVARAITHASSQVSVCASEGAAEYLEPEHRNLMLRCVGTVAMYTNLLVRNEQLRTRSGVRRFLGERQGVQSTLKQVRKAFVQGSINAEQELAELDLTSWHGMCASERILLMLGKAPSLALTKDLFTKTGQAIVDAWAAKRKSPNTMMNFDPTHTTNVLAGIALTMPPQIALFCCQPFLDAVNGYPDAVATFIEMLLIEENKRFHNETCFWAVWQAFADRIIDAPWSSRVSSSHSTGMKLVDKMLFRAGWEEDMQSWHPIVGHEHRINALTTSLPAVQPVLASFAHYLYKVGKSSLPDAFVVVAGRLREGNPAELLSGGNTVFYLESLLQRYVYGQPMHLKTDPRLREAVLVILDHLVDAGSSAAYKMRDDFVTPSVGSSYPQA